MSLLILERDRKREGRKRKRNIDVREKHWLPPVHTLTGDRTQNPGMCPDRESNLQHFGAWDGSLTK